MFPSALVHSLARAYWCGVTAPCAEARTPCGFGIRPSDGGSEDGGAVCSAGRWPLTGPLSRRTAEPGVVTAACLLATCEQSLPLQTHQSSTGEVSFIKSPTEMQSDLTPKKGNHLFVCLFIIF